MASAGRSIVIIHYAGRGVHVEGELFITEGANEDSSDVDLGMLIRRTALKGLLLGQQCGLSLGFGLPLCQRGSYGGEHTRPHR